jgi:pilus assembly protein Flp/PilA
MQKLINFLKEEDGASAAEYALILAIIGAGVGVAVFSLGSAITTKVGQATNCISATTSTAAATACNAGAAAS